MVAANFICPFCFERNPVASIQFRCRGKQASRCDRIQDPELAAYLGLAPEDVLRSRCFRVKNAFPLGRPLKSAACPVCGESSTQRICPACHHNLPYTVGEHEDLILAVIGAKEAGKSHYLAVLIETLRNQVAPAFDCSLSAMDDETINRYNQDFYEPVFKRREMIPITRSAAADTRVKQPLVFSLAFMKKSLLGGSKTFKTLTLAFFDTAGEDLNAEDTMAVQNKYIYNADGIVLLMDPLQLPELRLRLDLPEHELPRQNTEATDILDRTANLVRKARGLKPDRPIDIPLALAFSKFDALDERILDPGSLLRQPGGHLTARRFDLRDFHAVQTELRGLLLDDWQYGSLVQNLQHHFPRHAFFGLSALGCNPHATSRINRFRPRRVEDPLLWMLWERGLIKEAK